MKNPALASLVTDFSHKSVRFTFCKKHNKSHMEPRRNPCLVNALYITPTTSVATGSTVYINFEKFSVFSLVYKFWIWYV